MIDFAESKDVMFNDTVFHGREWQEVMKHIHEHETGTAGNATLSERDGLHLLLR